MAVGFVTVTATYRPATHDVEIVVESTGMNQVTVKRSDLSGAYEVVRLMDHAPVVPSGLFYGVDPEVPNGTVRYVATATDTTDGDADNSPAVEVEINHLPGDDRTGDWFMPLGILDRGMIVNVESFKSHTYTVDREIVPVLGRPDPVAVHYGRHWFNGSLVLITLEDADRMELEGILFDARVVVFCPRKGAGYLQPVYLSIGEVTAERISAYALEPARRWTMECQRIAAPPAKYAVIPIGNSWDDVRNVGDTWGERRLSDTWRTLMGF